MKQQYEAQPSLEETQNRDSETVFSFLENVPNANLIGEQHCL